MSMRNFILSPKTNFIKLLIVGIIVASCTLTNGTNVLRLGTTTSVEDSGLLLHLLPQFEEEHNAKVEIIAVGTGQALALAKRGDVDAMIVHAPTLEIEFMEEGYGIYRFDLMYNDFVIVGPSGDPAGVGGSRNAHSAFKSIADAKELFISRGDQSGTHIKEIELWTAAFNMGESKLPGGEWYLSVGQGMGATLNMANEMEAYTLSDRGTYLSQASNLSNLEILFGGSSIEDNLDVDLYNYYSVILVNPTRHPGLNIDLSSDFAAWITSYDTQFAIEKYLSSDTNTPLFYANSDMWRTLGKTGSDIANGGEDNLKEKETIWRSLELIFSGNSEFLEVVGRTIQVSGSALLLASIIGIPFGIFMGLTSFRGKYVLQIIIYTGMGLPPVVVGLILFLVLSNEGILGQLHWLFTPQGMILAQSILAIPIATGLTSSAVRAVPEELILQIRSLGASRAQSRWSILREARLGVVAAILAAFGRIVSEVGAVMLVGGNIQGSTRVLSTAIILETRQGSFELALALGLVLLGVALLSNVFVLNFAGRWNI